jgi:hypothetical protein
MKLIDIAVREIQRMQKAQHYAAIGPLLAAYATQYTLENCKAAKSLDLKREPLHAPNDLEVVVCLSPARTKFIIGEQVPEISICARPAWAIVDLENNYIGIPEEKILEIISSFSTSIDRVYENMVAQALLSCDEDETTLNNAHIIEGEIYISNVCNDFSEGLIKLEPDKYSHDKASGFIEHEGNHMYQVSLAMQMSMYVIAKA